MGQETEKDLEENQVDESTVTQEEKEVEEENQASDLLKAAQTEAAEFKDKYIRAHADFENAKKRLEKDKMNAVSYANESFAKDILAVLDSFENALDSIKGADKENASEVLEKMQEGVKLTYEQLRKVLEKNHIKEIECKGEFNPEVHQVIMQVESDAHDTNDIVQVMQRGYTIKDRVLRPAMVSTCK